MEILFHTISHFNNSIFHSVNAYYKQGKTKKLEIDNILMNIV